MTSIPVDTSSALCPHEMKLCCPTLKKVQRTTKIRLYSTNWSKWSNPRENTCSCTFDQILSLAHWLQFLSLQEWKVLCRALLGKATWLTASDMPSSLFLSKNIILELLGEDQLHDDKEFQHQWKNYCVKTLRIVCAWVVCLIFSLISLRKVGLQK